jgi:hypothetical protein
VLAAALLYADVFQCHVHAQQHIWTKPSCAILLLPLLLFAQSARQASL